VTNELVVAEVWSSGVVVESVRIEDPSAGIAEAAVGSGAAAESRLGLKLWQPQNTATPAKAKTLTHLKCKTMTLQKAYLIARQ
jgi:hypothetical protein